VWVRDAVFFRDHGRCVLCQVDLSGLLATDRSDHFDHMVPLEKWGINDPCNIQLLCEVCNLRKAAGESVTGYRYSPRWSY
jgi:5-methylcytosine-specific restriction endonuclease McrA